MTNPDPKQARGDAKLRPSCMPVEVLIELVAAMDEGARKYGVLNWRETGVRAHTYYDAALRHLLAWWSGIDTDPDSGLHHVTKAISSLVVLRDAMLCGACTDDRPPL